MQKRTPGLRQTLQPSVDVLGQPRQDFGPVQALADPTKATTDVAQSNPLLSELVRLDQGISGFRKKADETPDNYHRRVQVFGKLYSLWGHTLINSPQYRAVNDTDRREIFALLNSRAKSLADEGDEREAPTELSPASLFDALRQKRMRQAKH